MCVSSLPAHLTKMHARFVALMPRIELHAHVYFRHVQCPGRRGDAVAETLALAWKWFAELAQWDRDASNFVPALAGYAARAVSSGRRLCGQERAKDVLSPTAQRRQGFAVGRLPDVSSVFGNIWHEALTDNTQSPIPDQVWFRLDFPCWRASLAERDRRLIDDLMTSGRTKDVARRFGLTASRVSQLRREFHADWLRFHGESAEGGQTPDRAGRRPQ